MGVGMAVFVHLIPPPLDDLGGLPQNIGRPSGYDLYLAAGGEFDAGRGSADRLVQGRVGFLQRFRNNLQVVDVGVLAVEGETFLGPGPGYYLHCFLEPFPALLHVDAYAVELLALIACADAEVEASPADDVEHGRLFSHQNRVVQGQHDHSGADADPLGPGRYLAQKGEYPGQEAVPGKPVLPQPYLVDSQLVGQFDLLHGFA